jgi:outer membrane protein
MRRLGSAFALALFAVAAFGSRALADEYRIAVIHVERILSQSKPARAAEARLEQEFKARDADLRKREQDLQAAASDLATKRATLSPEQLAAREREIDAGTREAQRLREKFAEDLRARQFEELDKLKARLDQVLTKYAKAGNYDLILQDALWVGRAVDITDDVIDALEKADDSPGK